MEVLYLSLSSSSESDPTFPGVRLTLLTPKTDLETYPFVNFVKDEFAKLDREKLGFTKDSN